MRLESREWTRRMNTLETSTSRKSHASKKEAKPGLGVRHLQAFLLFLFFTLDAICTEMHLTLITIFKDYNTTFQNIRGEYFLTVIGGLSFILGGYLCTKFNNKFIISVCLVCITILSYCSPIAAMNDSTFYITTIFRYVAVGLSGPQAYSLISCWIPPSELSFLGPLILSGEFVGRAIAHSFGPSMRMSTKGGQTMFYFSGNVCLVYTLAFVFLGAQSPETCWFITDEERNYLRTSLASKAKGYFRRKVPFLPILKSSSFYPQVFCILGKEQNTKSAIWFMIQIMIYAYRLDYRTRNLWAAGSYLIVFIGVAVIAFIARFVFRRELVSTKTFRFTANTVAFYGMGASMILLADVDSFLSTFFVYFTVFLNSFAVFGYGMNYFDLAPNYPGYLFGLSAGIANLLSVPLLYIRDVVILGGNPDVLKIRGLLVICGFSSFLAGLSFTAMGSTQRQDYNDAFDEDPQRAHS